LKGLIIEIMVVVDEVAVVGVLANEYGSSPCDDACNGDGDAFQKADAEEAAVAS